MILVSGANGFVGRRLVSSMRADGVETRSLIRGRVSDANCVVADLADKDALLRACTGVESVFHCAGYAHAFSSSFANDSALHWKVNFEGTRNIVEAAGIAGVRRFVFLSTVKAMADPGVTCVGEDLAGFPTTAYGLSKRAAEDIVLDVGSRFGMHVVNLRLVMVYGRGGGGNLERMGRLVARGLFPPLPENGNHRSLVHVDDVVSAARRAVYDSRAAGRTFIVASGDAPSGRELFDMLRAVSGLPPLSCAVPAVVMRMVARLGDGLECLLRRPLLLNSQVLERLLGSAWYSPALIERELGWRSKVSLAEGLSEMLGK